MRCKDCGGETIQGFTSVYCKTECDLQPKIKARISPLPESIFDFKITPPGACAQKWMRYPFTNAGIIQAVTDVPGVMNASIHQDIYNHTVLVEFERAPGVQGDLLTEVRQLLDDIRPIGSIVRVVEV